MSNNLLIIKEFETLSKKRIGYIAINNDSKLNALNLAICEDMLRILEEWDKNSQIICIFIEGIGEKAFCSGDDIVLEYHSVTGKLGRQYSYAKEFVEAEYRLDYYIRTYKKPIICWADGITYGGGVGLLAGCQFRIVTEKTQLSMPEITIGLHMDVGSSYFLSRLHNNIGLFIGLTGATLNGADVIFINLADNFIKSSFKERLKKSLQSEKWSTKNSTNYSILYNILGKLELQSRYVFPDSNLETHQELISSIINYRSLPEISKAIKSIRTEDRWLKKSIQNFNYGSPTSALLIFNELKKGRKQTLKECFKQELIVTVQCFYHHDFAEGVRALLIDKDFKPKWFYKSIEEVPESWINEHYENPFQLEGNPFDDLVY